MTDIEQEEPRKLEGFQKFTSISGFSHVYRSQEYFEKRAEVYYGAKIKLHGTHAGVRITRHGEVVAQSRTQDIFPGKGDNCGFAGWVASESDAWAKLASEPSGDIVVYGEWAGKGIQKGDAVCGLDQKYFFVYGVYQVESDHYLHDPESIEGLVPDLDQLVVLPWDSVCTQPVDFHNADDCARFADMLNDSITEIGESDPLIYGLFGVDGPGEGWVLSPICTPWTDPTSGNTKFIDAHWFRTLAFKVKTEAHSVQKTKPAARDIVVPEGVAGFVEMFVTEARCNQGVYEVVGYADTQFTGDFLKWIGQDIKKESGPELEEAGLEWKDVTKHVMMAARNWWLAKCEVIS